VQVPVPLVALFLACRLPSFICVVVPFVVYTLTRSLPNPTSNTFAQQSTMRSSTMFAALAASLTVRAADIDMEGLPNTGLDTSAWVTGQNPPIDDMVDANDFQFAAKNKLDGRRYAYYRTAALDEITYERNMHDWEKVRMNGFAFNDVSNLNRKTKILGHEFDSPFFIAPAAEAGYTDPDAERNLARAAGDANVLYVPSVSSTLSIEEIAAAGRDNQIMFHQEYIWEDRDRLQDELDRMKNSGFRAIFLTTDNTGVKGVRPRYDRFRTSSGSSHASDTSIKAMNELRQMTDLPIVPKGLKSAHDVKLCADLGFPAVYISNHGGRQVDMGLTAIEVLLDLHRDYPEVFDQIEIYADGGVRHASHMVTLISLGVTAVGVGRPFYFANIYGQDGVSKLIDIFNTELESTMRLMGEDDIRSYRGNSTFVSSCNTSNPRTYTN
jgi:isopentenyl diphosphate isomerase/L-lactate dehydrogenase-like FMN-dependent dehydrogenase